MVNELDLDGEIFTEGKELNEDENLEHTENREIVMPEFRVETLDRVDGDEFQEELDRVEEKHISGEGFDSTQSSVECISCDEETSSKIEEDKEESENKGDQVSAEEEECPSLVLGVCEKCKMPKQHSWYDHPLFIWLIMCLAIFYLYHKLLYKEEESCHFLN